MPARRIAVATWVVAGALISSFAFAQTPAGKAPNGEEVFKRTCAACHTAVQAPPLLAQQFLIAFIAFGVQLAGPTLSLRMLDLFPRASQLMAGVMEPPAKAPAKNGKQPGNPTLKQGARR